MQSTVLPYAYSLLVFAIVAFLFVLLGRIFLNVEIIYSYEFDIVLKGDAKYSDEVKQIIEERGKQGWKFERSEELYQHGQNSFQMMLIFVKSKNKIKLFG